MDFRLIQIFLTSRVKWETERNNSLWRMLRRMIFYDLDSEVDPERLQYLYIYTILIVVVLYLVFQRALALFYFCLKASRRIHEKLFQSVTRAPMYFFNKNSSGRIINRFSKDINDIDYYLPSVLYDSILVSWNGRGRRNATTIKSDNNNETFQFDCFQFVLQVTTSLILVLLANYWLVIPTVVMSIIFFGLRHVYVRTARCLKRMESMGMFHSNENCENKIEDKIATIPILLVQ